MKKTAVEFLEDALHGFIHPEHGKDFIPILEKAKAMEKEQIMKSAQDNFYVGQDLANGHKVDWNSAEEYYNKTYGKNERD